MSSKSEHKYLLLVFILTMLVFFLFFFDFRKADALSSYSLQFLNENAVSNTPSIQRNSLTWTESAPITVYGRYYQSMSSNTNYTFAVTNILGVRYVPFYGGVFTTTTNVFIVTNGGSTVDITNTCSISNSYRITNDTVTRLLQFYTYITCESFSPTTNSANILVRQTFENEWPSSIGQIRAIAYSASNILLTGSSSLTDSDKIILNDNKNTQSIISNQNNNQNQTNDRLDSINDSLNSTNQAITDINDSLNDSSVSNPSSSLNNISSSIASNGNISSLVLLPVTLFQKLANSVKTTCSSFNLGELYGHNLSIPCINPQLYLGNSIWNFVDIVSTSFLLFYISKCMINLFNDLSNLKEGRELD